MTRDEPPVNVFATSLPPSNEKGISTGFTYMHNTSPTDNPLPRGTAYRRWQSLRSVSSWPTGINKLKCYRSPIHSKCHDKVSLRKCGIRPSDPGLPVREDGQGGVERMTQLMRSNDNQRILT